MILAAIRDCVRRDCLSAGNAFGPAFFDEHLAVVADCGRRLAGRFGADPDTVELAAWLHDLSAVRDLSTLADHPRASAALARELLREQGCDAEAIECVAQAIASHSMPVAPGAGPPEAVALSNADAIAQIVRPAYWLYFAFAVRGLGFEEGRQWVARLVEGKWQALTPAAKDLADGGYRISRETLEFWTAGEASGR
jgi:hypothetical protein